MNRVQQGNQIIRINLLVLMPQRILRSIFYLLPNELLILKTPHTSPPNKPHPSLQRFPILCHSLS